MGAVRSKIDTQEVTLFLTNRKLAEGRPPFDSLTSPSSTQRPSMRLSKRLLIFVKENPVAATKSAREMLPKPEVSALRALFRLGLNSRNDGSRCQSFLSDDQASVILTRKIQIFTK